MEVFVGIDAILRPISKLAHVERTMSNVTAVTGRRSVWHGLMYSTGYLLIICGLPGTCVAALVFFLNGTMTKWEAVRFVAVLIGLEVLIAGVLLGVASFIMRQRSRQAKV